jgi:tetratricopeptide (TPR) repeat protein
VRAVLGRVVATSATLALALSSTLALCSMSALAPVASAQAPLRRVDRAAELRAQGDAHLAAGDRGSAIGWYRDALSADPSDARSYAALGRIYLDRGSLDDARAVLEAGASRAPDHAPLWLMLSEVLERIGAGEEAAQALRVLVRRQPTDPTAHRARAELARRRGAWSEALTAYRAIAALAEGATEVDPELVAQARDDIAALGVLVATLDPVRRGCETGSPLRRALARCARAR